MSHETHEYPPHTPPAASAVELRVGQMVPYPHAPDGVAQVDELLRRRVVLLYLRAGHVCRRRVRAVDVAAYCRCQPLLLGQAENLLGRGIVRRTKRYELRRSDAEAW